MFLLHRPDIDEYKAIHKEDASLFQEIVDNNLFYTEKDGNIIRHENKIRLITDRQEIKKVLDSNFSSRNRTEEYEAGLPSASVINALFPIDIDYRKQNGQSKFGILKWWNNISIEDMNAQKIKNKLSTDSGTYIHRILELCMLDTDTRMFIKKRSLNKYIELVNSDSEILEMIKNFDNRKCYFTDMAQKTLKKFFEYELEKIHPIYNEFFFIIPNKIQGSIDLVNYKDKKLYISDFKTSKKSLSREQAKDKGYLRQLLIYADAMYEIGMINKKERDNLCYSIYFWNWNSYNSAIYEYDKKELEKNRAYISFILNWYWDIKNN